MKKLKKLLTTIIWLAAMPMNASGKEMQQSQLETHLIPIPADLIPTVGLYLELKDITHLCQTQVWPRASKSVLEVMTGGRPRCLKNPEVSAALELMIEGKARFLKEKGDLQMLILDIEWAYQTSSIAPIPIPELSDEITTFVEKYTSCLNSRVYTKSFIFPGSQNENCGSIPQNSIAAQGFVGTLVTEACLRIYSHNLFPCEEKVGLIDLILSCDHQWIIAIRRKKRIFWSGRKTCWEGLKLGSYKGIEYLDILYLFKDKSDMQYKVSNTHQNRAVACMLSRFSLLAEHDDDGLYQVCTLFFSDAERIGEDEVAGFFDNPEPIETLTPNPIFQIIRCIISYISDLTTNDQLPY